MLLKKLKQLLDDAAGHNDDREVVIVEMSDSNELNTAEIIGVETADPLNIFITVKGLEQTNNKQQKLDV